jgi:hypothetical protein
MLIKSVLPLEPGLFSTPESPSYQLRADLAERLASHRAMARGAAFVVPGAALAKPGMVPGKVPVPTPAEVDIAVTPPLDPLPRA